MMYKINKKDYLEIWGHLQTLKDILEKSAREAVKLEDKDLGVRLAGSCMQTCAKIINMQSKIDEEAEELE